MTEENRQPADVSISIVNWNTRGDLLECLDSLIPSELREGSSGSLIPMNGLTYEVIVVDNNSEDESAEAVQKQFPVAIVLKQPVNSGFGRGHNRAFAEANARYHFVLNPDTILHKDTLPILVAFAQTHPEGAVFGPRILNTDGSIQYSARKFPTLMAGLFRHSILGRLFPNNRYTREYLQTDWDHSDSREVDWVSGAAMLIRDEVLRHLGGMDEDYYMYVEDVDICWRARQNGWQVWFCAESELFHKKARASDLMPNRMIYHHHRSMYLFFKKHYSANASLLERIITPIGLFVRASYFIARNKLGKWLRGRK